MTEIGLLEMTAEKRVPASGGQLLSVTHTRGHCGSRRAWGRLSKPQPGVSLSAPAVPGETGPWPQPERTTRMRHPGLSPQQAGHDMTCDEGF